MTSKDEMQPIFFTILNTPSIKVNILFNALRTFWATPHAKYG